MLVAIAIPVFTGQLEKAKEATDAANIRSAYSVVQTAALTQPSQTELSKSNTADTTYTVTGSEGSYVITAIVQLKQTQNEWQSGVPDIGGIKTVPQSVASGKATITYTQATGETTLTIA